MSNSLCIKKDLGNRAVLFIIFFLRFSTDVGHYTAMIWSNTNKVGCGVTEYVDGKWFAKLYTCNYGPAGTTFTLMTQK